MQTAVAAIEVTAAVAVAAVVLHDSVGVGGGGVEGDARCMWWLGDRCPDTHYSAPSPRHITISIHSDQEGLGNYGGQNRLLLASFGCAEAQVGCLRPHSKGTTSRRCCVARFAAPHCRLRSSRVPRPLHAKIILAILQV